MKRFNKFEILSIVFILLLIGAATYPNMRIAVRRARDVQRREDLGRIIDALAVYHQQFSFYPPSDNGNLKACKGQNYDNVISKLNSLQKFDKALFLSGLAECLWGKDSFRNVTSTGQEAYLSTMPQDPSTKSGMQYLYLSDSNFFQIYSYLEGEKEEAGYDADIVRRGLQCGSKICNFGKGSPGTPLDISIEEYEKELTEKNQ